MEQISRTRLSAQLRNGGVDPRARIERLALDAIAAAPNGPAATLKDLGTTYETTFESSIGRHPVYVALFWHSGLIRSEIRIPGRMRQIWNHIDLELGRLPDTTLVASAGRRLDDVIELPFSSECRVNKASASARGLRLDLEMDEFEVDCATGIIGGLVTNMAIAA